MILPLIGPLPCEFGAVSSKVLPLPAPLLDKEGLGEVLSGANNPPKSSLGSGEASETTFLETALAAGTRIFSRATARKQRGHVGFVRLKLLVAGSPFR